MNITQEQLEEIQDDIANATVLLWEDGLESTSDCIRIDELIELLVKKFPNFKLKY